MQRTAVALFSGLLCAAGHPDARAHGDSALPQSGRVTVEHAVAEALANNLALLAERVNIGIAEARLISARLRPNPLISAGGDHVDLLGTRFTEINGAGPVQPHDRSHRGRGKH